MTTRALIAVRLSATRDNSTSPERQLAHCRSAIEARGWTEAGHAEDLAISATKYSPFERPDLGPWLTDPEKISQWDTLIVWRLDRLVRSTADLAELLTWCEKHSKGFVSATEGFDLSTPFGKAMVTIIAALGQLEADTTRLRVQDAHDKLRTTDRWASGVPPLGFTTAPHPSGKGVGLVPDPDAKELLHTMAEKLLSGWSFTAITGWLNESGHLTAMDRARVAKGKEPRKAPWTVGNVTRCLSSPATQGIKVRRVEGYPASPGEPVLDSGGQPIRMAAPTFDDETWEQIQLAVAERKASGKRRKHSSNPMLGIGYCGLCGASLAQQVSYSKDKTKEYRTYRCGRTPINCKGVSAKAGELERLFERAFLLAYGEESVREKVFVPGTDNRHEIEQAKQSLTRLRAESDAGLIDDNDEYLTRLKALTERLRALEKTPYRPSGWEYRETGETYREAWQGADFERRRELLIGAEARVVLSGKDRADFELNYEALRAS